MNHPCTRLVFSNKNRQYAISPTSTDEYKRGVTVPPQEQIPSIRLLKTTKHPSAVSLLTTHILKPSGPICNSSNEITEQEMYKKTTITPVSENFANSVSPKDTSSVKHDSFEASSAIATCKNILLTNFLLIFCQNRLFLNMDHHIAIGL